MSDLIAIVYPKEQDAEAVRARLFEMQKEYLIEIGDAVIAAKGADGHVKLNQLFSTTAVGAVSGGFWGMLIGTLFLMPFAGAAIGAATGALGGSLSDFGIDDKFMKDLAESTQPGNAVLFVLIRKMTADKVLDGIKGMGGVVLRTSFDHEKEQQLREALSQKQAAVPPQPAV
ncbi:DUF1269 domain-containing protein [Rhodoblastus acidophilus]|jgi:uncharacterized membrane protein|uniref:DUF1269 domain-containing protein n=1 Tax=Rhodoblastus acidophilus TaxID=1074 RepID=A0A6N8DS81_RHOAC|nr:DUF1269 domain-containing protein [Rhodoblastus acidophilus]MCW2275540.1 putative membrane protein [Rhodoblastus acidophilus]MTV32041.1 DUF1269 domain-containing protein [Rhodoblastus acidophilus]